MFLTLTKKRHYYCCGGSGGSAACRRSVAGRRDGRNLRRRRLYSGHRRGSRRHGRGSGGHHIQYKGKRYKSVHSAFAKALSHQKRVQRHHDAHKRRRSVRRKNAKRQNVGHEKARRNNQFGKTRSHDKHTPEFLSAFERLRSAGVLRRKFVSR